MSPQVLSAGLHYYHGRHLVAQGRRASTWGSSSLKHGGHHSNRAINLQPKCISWDGMHNIDPKEYYAGLCPCTSSALSFTAWCRLQSVLVSGK